MRRLSFRVQESDKEDVLDALLPLLPAGVHEEADGGLSSFAGSLPSRETLEAAVGRALEDYAEEEVPADGATGAPASGAAACWCASAC